MTRSSAVLAVAIAVAATSTGLIWWSRAEAQEVPSRVTQPEHPAKGDEQDGTQPIAPAVGSVVPDPVKPAINPPLPASKTLLLPDGTRVPTLNGATNAKPLADAWPANVPWSPILHIERSDVGVDWFVHADGSRSTTEMKWRSDLGREDAVTRLARPTPKLPNVQAPK